MAELKRKLMVMGYSYDEDDSTLEIELDGASAICLDEGLTFVESIYGQFEEIKAGEVNITDTGVHVSYNADSDTLTIDGIDNIDTSAFYGIMEEIYNEYL